MNSNGHEEASIFHVSDAEFKRRVIEKINALIIKMNSLAGRVSDLEDRINAIDSRVDDLEMKE
jgi:hypothetical protein